MYFCVCVCACVNVCVCQCMFFFVCVLHVCICACLFVSWILFQCAYVYMYERNYAQAYTSVWISYECLCEMRL
jgi:hypothetical protein